MGIFIDFANVIKDNGEVKSKKMKIVQYSVSLCVGTLIAILMTIGTYR